MAFVRVLNRLSNVGRYAFYTYYYAFQTNQILCPGTGHQAVIYPEIDRVQGVDLKAMASSLSSTSDSFEYPIRRGPSFLPDVFLLTFRLYPLGWVCLMTA